MPDGGALHLPTSNAGRWQDHGIYQRIFWDFEFDSRPRRYVRRARICQRSPFAGMNLTPHCLWEGTDQLRMNAFDALTGPMTSVSPT